MVGFWGALLGFIEQLGASAAGAVAEGTAGAGAVAEGAAGALSESAAGALSEMAAGGGQIGGITEAAAAPLDAAQGALEAMPKPAPTPAATPALAQPATPTVEPPAVQALMKPAPTPDSVMADITGPQMSTVPPSGAEAIDLSANMSTEAGPVSTLPGPTTGTRDASRYTDNFIDKIQDWWNSDTMMEIRDTYAKAKELNQKYEEKTEEPGGRLQLNVESPTLPAEQAAPDTPALQIPDIGRVETSDLGMSRGTGEQPLSFEQLKRMQREGIMDLIGQLRTQRRLFG
jgi:hypothetical protein